ncbi:MAG: hypothetical protein D6775_01420 [Caldilineae bacterium]|nr:MAG: hypothetical protein D6775_01420 [Caldilineae bacterium]
MPQIGPQAAGRQGGVIIHNASLNPLQVAATREKSFTMSDGYPAVKVHDNTIITPRGPALLIRGVGNMVITDNQLTSQGALPLAASNEANASEATAPSAYMGAVFILNLGVADELIGQFAGFAKMAATATRASETAETPLSVRPVRGDLRGVTLDGAVLFSNNQVLFNLMRAEKELAATSVSIFSLDDVGFHNNQLEVVIPQSDRVLADALVVGLRVRAAGNVFKETFGRVFASLMSAGFVNSTSFNQGNHCILAYASNAAYLQDVGNIALLCRLGHEFERYRTAPEARGNTNEARAARAYNAMMKRADEARIELAKSIKAGQEARLTALRLERTAVAEAVERNALELGALDAELHASEALRTSLTAALASE